MFWPVVCVYTYIVNFYTGKGSKRRYHAGNQTCKSTGIKSPLLVSITPFNALKSSQYLSCHIVDTHLSLYRRYQVRQLPQKEIALRTVCCVLKRFTEKKCHLLVNQVKAAWFHSWFQESFLVSPGVTSICTGIVVLGRIVLYFSCETVKILSYWLDFTLLYSSYDPVTIKSIVLYFP